MKNLAKIFSVFAASTLMLTSCIEETFPESGSATSEQIGSSSSALEAALNGIPAQMSQGYLVYGDQVTEIDMGYPCMMIAQTELLGDMYPGGANSGFDWYRCYNTAPASGSVNQDTDFSYIPWYTFYMFVKAANDIISSVDIESNTTTNMLKGYAGVAYAYRAFCYYNLMIFWEPVANKYTDCSSVLGLTVPLVTETTSGAESKNNPRVKHDVMMKFILSDLEKAETLLKLHDAPSKLLPGLAAAYGIHARVSMWDEDYATAAKYARLAITTSGATPMTESEWTSPTSAFTTAVSSWIWYQNYAAETMGNLCNFTGWMSGEADWGYSSLTLPMIDRSLYDKIAANDFRKHVFVDPAKYDYYNYQTVRDKSYIEETAPAYLALKFRCKGGNWEDYTAGATIDLPVMRVEEMYLIEAEAVAQTQGVANGLELLNSFMKNYRQSDYSCKAKTLRDLQLAILDQMKIEFWGEGEAFPMAKRIKAGAMQNYEGTNAPSDIFKINLEGIKPNWNFCIPTEEIQGNPGIGENNPDPTATIKAPSPVGAYSDKK